MYSIKIKVFLIGLERNIVRLEKNIEKGHGKIENDPKNEKHDKEVSENETKTSYV